MNTFDVILNSFDSECAEDVAYTIFDILKDESFQKRDLDNLPLILVMETDARTAHYVQFMLQRLANAEVEVVDHESRETVNIDIANVTINFRAITRNKKTNFFGKPETAKCSIVSELVSPALARRSLGLPFPPHPPLKVPEPAPVTLDMTPVKQTDVYSMAFDTLRFAEDHTLYQRAAGRFIRALLCAGDDYE